MAGFSEQLVKTQDSRPSPNTRPWSDLAAKVAFRELLPRRFEVLEGTVAGPVGADGPGSVLF